MKIDAREIAALTQAQPAAPRMDMYASIHKALRAFMADTLLWAWAAWMWTTTWSLPRPATA